jgi:hypothetical protein
MKTFQQFNEDARDAGAIVRQGLNRAASATYNFGKGFFTGKSGTKPGSAQHRGAQLRKAGDERAREGMRISGENQARRNRLIQGGIRNTTDFVKGLVTGTGSKKN